MYVSLQMIDKLFPLLLLGIFFPFFAPVFLSTYLCGGVMPTNEYCEIIGGSFEITKYSPLI